MAREPLLLGAPTLDDLFAPDSPFPGQIRHQLACSALRDDDPWITIGTLGRIIQHPPVTSDGHLLDVVFRAPPAAGYFWFQLTVDSSAFAPAWRGYRLHLAGRPIRLALAGMDWTGPEQVRPADEGGPRFKIRRTTDDAVVLDVELFVQWAFRPVRRIVSPDDPRGDEPSIIAVRWWGPRLLAPVDHLRYTTHQRDHKGDSYRQAERASALLRDLRLDGARDAHRPSRSPDAVLDELAGDAVTWVRGRRGRTLAEVGDRELAEVRVTGVSAVEEIKRVNRIKIAAIRRRAAELLIGST